MPRAKNNILICSYYSYFRKVDNKIITNFKTQTYYSDLNYLYVIYFLKMMWVEYLAAISRQLNAHTDALFDFM